MLKLTQSSKKIPGSDVNVLDFINTLDLYKMINEGMNKHYQCDAAQRVTNDMMNITKNLPPLTAISKQHMQDKKISMT